MNGRIFQNIGDPEVKSIQTFVTAVSDSVDILSQFKQLSSWPVLLKVVVRIKRLGSKQKYHCDYVTVEECERADQACTAGSILQTNKDD